MPATTLGVLMQLYTSHWRNPELGKLAAQIVSISRGQPRRKLPFRYKKLMELAPDDHTWRQEDKERFEASYVRQLEGLGAERILADLERIVGGCPAIILLCWERPHEELCHRWSLSRWMYEQTGIVIPELQAGDLPRREDTVELRLFEELPREESMTEGGSNEDGDGLR